MNDDMKRPVAKVMEGTVHLSVWRNEGSKGPFYSATIEKRYTDDAGQWHSTYSFGRNDLEKLRLAIDQVIDKIDALESAKTE